jgi:predicted lipid carrier protein YhbT
MTTPEQLLTELATRVAQNAPELEKIGATFKFELIGDPLQVWLVRLEPPAAVTRVESGVASADVDADGVFRLSGEDFVALMTGKVTGQQLFFNGRLEVEGDLTLALKLRELTQVLRS